jgi:hypothetical protein
MLESRTVDRSRCYDSYDRIPSQTKNDPNSILFRGSWLVLSESIKRRPLRTSLTVTVQVLGLHTWLLNRTS